MTFNPYAAWLDIPATEQPATHYRLLGLDDFETDADRIHTAALQRISELRKHQTGSQGDLTQQLMNEVSAARVCLLDPERKAAYDLDLQILCDRTRSRRITKRTWWIAGGSATLLATAVGIWALFASPDSLRPPASDGGRISHRGVEPGSNEPEKAPLEATAASPVFPPLPAGWRPLLEDGVRHDLGEHYCRIRFPEGRLETDAKRDRIVVAVPAGERRVLWLPPPADGFRMQCRIDTESPDSLQVTVGAYRDVDVGDLVEWRRENDGWTVRDRGNRGATALRRAGSTAWIDVRGTPSRFFAWAADGAGVTPLGERPRSAGGAIAIGIAVINKSNAPASVAIGPCRVDGRDDRYEERLKAWPRRPPQPNSDVLRELFAVGDLTLAGGQIRRQFTFLTADERALWNGVNLADRPGVKLVGPHRVPLGPIHHLRRLAMHTRFLGPDAAIEITSNDGGGVRFDARTGISLLNSDPQTQKVAKLSIERPMQWVLTRNQLGAVAVRIDDKVVLNGRLPNASGTLTVQTHGKDAIELTDFVVEGELDWLPIWCAALRGEDNPYFRYLRRADAAAVQRVMPAVGQPAFADIRRLGSTPERLALEPGVPVNLHFVNTAEDEDLPRFEDAAGLVLHFCRQLEGRSRGFVARRTNPEQQFSVEGQLVGLPDQGVLRGVSFAPDRLTAMFASSMAGNLDIYQATRDFADVRFVQSQAVNATRTPADELAPTLSADSLELYFTRDEGGGKKTLFQASRMSPRVLFEDPKPLPFRGGFAYASLTADGKTMYLQGPSSGGGPSMLFRSRRGGRDQSWREPEPVRETPRGIHGNGPARDATPFVTPDGRHLLFASDRDGGMGGMDLWMVALGDLIANAPSSPTKLEPPIVDAKAKTMPEKTAKKSAPKPPVAKREALPITGSFPQWLVLGPLPRDAGEQDNADPVRKLLRASLFQGKVPELGDEDRVHKLAWQRSGAPLKPNHVYLVLMPFRLESKAARVVVSVDSAPGGGVFALGSHQQRFDIGPNDPWSAPHQGLARSRAIDLVRGRHRIVGVVCVADAAVPLKVRILDADSETPADGIVTAF